MRSSNGNAVTQTRSAARAGILVPQTQDSLRRRAVTKPSHSHMQTRDASSSRNRERRSIQAFTLCGDDVSVPNVTPTSGNEAPRTGSHACSKRLPDRSLGIVCTRRGSRRTRAPNEACPFMG
jgi:hypothetical protein